MKKKNEIIIKTEYTSNYLKTVFIVFIMFIVVYGVVLALDKMGIFEKGYEAPEKKEAEISNEYILAGSTFNRMEKEYYVVFDEFNSDNVYLNYILDNTSSDLHIYKVNMLLKVNAVYNSESSNKKVQKAADLLIKSPTLIKIKNGKNVLYLDDIEKIKEELIY